MSKEPDNNSGIPQCKITSHSPSAPTNNRWWENYLVRYLVPSIVGMFILIILNKVTDDSIKNLLFSFYANKSENKLSNTILIIWFLLGTGFCYIASYPILALHVLARFTKNNDSINRNKMTVKIVIPILCSLMFFMASNLLINYKIIKTDSVINFMNVIALVAIILVCISLFLVSNTYSLTGVPAIAVVVTGMVVVLFSATDIRAAVTTMGVIVIAAIIAVRAVRISENEAGTAVIAAIITAGVAVAAVTGTTTELTQLGITLAAGAILLIVSCLLTIPHEAEFSKTYFDSLKKRYSIEDTKPNANITDSYKHLREHGNTSLIIILEVILAICLYPSLKHINFKTHEEVSFWVLTFTVLALIAWLIPAAIIYFFGHALESEHVD